MLLTMYLLTMLLNIIHQFLNQEKRIINRPFQIHYLRFVDFKNSYLLIIVNETKREKRKHIVSAPILAEYGISEYSGFACMKITVPLNYYVCGLSSKS